MSSATDVWKALPLPWQVAFEEAWASFCAGNFGIGAVLTDPDVNLHGGGAIVTAGRNRVNQTHRSPRTLSGNMTAHAEMNAFAELDRLDAEGLHLYTTLEPCLMCAATAIQLNVAHVHFAAADEFFVGMNDLWAHHPISAERQPAATGPFVGELAAFARLLPMIFTLERFPGRAAAELARAEHPRLVALIDRLPNNPTWTEIRESGTCDHALEHLWDDL